MVASQSIIQRFHAAVVEHRSDALHAPPFPNPSACPEGLLPASCLAPLLGYLERLRACLSPALQLHNCACTLVLYAYRPARLTAAAAVRTLFAVSVYSFKLYR